MTGWSWSRVFLVNATSERVNSESQGDVIPENPEVSMPEPVACQSARAQAARLAWARRPRRLTPLPWPIPRVFWSGLRLDVPGEEIVTGMECRGLFNGLAEFGVALCS